MCEASPTNTETVTTLRAGERGGREGGGGGGGGAREEGGYSRGEATRCTAQPPQIAPAPV